MMDVLRFIVAGSVDDGKSTLIGRLLYETKSVYTDQLEAIDLASKNSKRDLSLLTDGLRSEREQGITIDVAYRYFQTSKRKFIIIDAPGHKQYTRNMVTGASHADVAVMLIDVRLGVIEQTRRHFYIAHLLGIKHIYVCVNKMDTVNYQEDLYRKVVKDYQTMANLLAIDDLRFFPVSALHGDNIVFRSDATPWYQDETLLDVLEKVEMQDGQNSNDPRLFVQTVLRYPTHRAYAGRVSSGMFQKGDPIKIFPSLEEISVSEILKGGKSIEKAYPGMSVAVTLEGDLDVSRGYLISGATRNLPRFQNEMKAMVCWMGVKPARRADKYVMQVGTSRVRAMVKEIHYSINMDTFEKEDSKEMLNLNDIALVTVRTATPVAFDTYKQNRQTGSAILIDETGNHTVGGCMVTD